MVKIIKAKPKDLEDISKIWVRETSKKPYSASWTEKTALKEIKDFYKRAEINLAIINGKIAGFIISKIIAGGKKGYIEELRISSKYQGKGIGTNLMEFVEKMYRKKGVKNLGVTANQKARAVHFYKKLGYKQKYAFYHMDKTLK